MCVTTPGIARLSRDYARPPSAQTWNLQLLPWPPSRGRPDASCTFAGCQRVMDITSDYAVHTSAYRGLQGLGLGRLRAAIVRGCPTSMEARSGATASLSRGRRLPGLSRP